MKRKNIFIIIIILSIITIIALGTYALSIWRSAEDTELTMRIGDITEVYFEEGNDIKIDNIAPIFDYEKDGIENTFKIKNITTNEIVINIKLNITEIDTALIHKSFKYVLMASESKEGTYEKISEGSFEDTITKSVLNVLTGYKLTTETYFKIIFYIDANMENPIKMQDKSLEGYITAEAFPNYAMEGVTEFIDSTEIAFETTNFLSTKIPKNKIESIDFIKINPEEIPENSIGEYDVSLAKNRSVLLYYTDNDSDELYEVMIGTETGTTVASSGFGLFSWLTNMSNINLTNLDTSKVTTMANMFYNSVKLTEIDVGYLNTSKVTNMSGMFYSDYYLLDEGGLWVEIDPILEKIEGLENLDTSNVTNMSRMFSGCIHLDSIDFSNFDTANVTDMSFMFNDIMHLVFNLDSFNTSKVTNMSGMFANVYNFTSSINSFDTSNVTDMSSMFSRITYLSTDLSNLDTSNVTNMNNMFSDVWSGNLDFKNFDTSKVTNMSGMFRNINAHSLDLSSFDTSNVTDMSDMFYSSDKLYKIEVSDSFKTTNVKKSESMFKDSKNLKGGNGTTYDPDHIDAEYARIDGGTANPGYFTLKT